MRVACLRFFTVYGPGQRPDLAIHSFTDAIEHGRPIKQFGDGTTRRDYTYVDDIVQGVLGALSYVDGEGPLFEIFNLGENETTTLAQLIASIEKVLGKKAVIERFPEQKGDMPLTAADITKAHGYGGMRLQRVDTDTHELKLGEGKILGDNIIFNMTPSPGASVCLHNAYRDAEQVVSFLKGEYSFDKEAMNKDLCSE